MKKILIIGLGSIGQRHVEALFALGEKNIAAYRTGKGGKHIPNEFLNRIQIFNSVDSAFAWHPTHIVISNPTSLHLYFIKQALKQECKFFVEKPIADEMEDVLSAKLIENISGVVGYNLRFHGLFIFLKNIINSGRYGSVITAKLHVGQFLPDWHPYEDYRNTYFARKELGGGAIRTLSHEIDLTQFLFGEVQTVWGNVKKLSKLEINVDDVVDLTFKTDLCEQVTMHINFLEPNIIRKGEIYFEDGLLTYDYISSEINFTNYHNKNKKVIFSQKENYNQQYILQMQEFLNEKKQRNACNFQEGLKVMQIIEKSEESNLKRKEICLI